MRYKVIYSSTTLVDLYIQLPDFPQFADACSRNVPTMLPYLRARLSLREQKITFPSDCKILMHKKHGLRDTGDPLQRIPAVVHTTAGPTCPTV